MMEKPVETAMVVVDLTLASHTALQSLVIDLLREPNIDARSILQEALERPRRDGLDAEDAARAMAGVLLDLIAAIKPALGVDGPVTLSAEMAAGLRLEIAQAEETIDAWEMPA